ncbi:MAG: glycosyltransferase family 4 protein [Thermoleophilia bacterium]|nr:glycosyltransferase family 4 protein [Thermoleophilia bacterium]
MKIIQVAANLRRGGMPLQVLGLSSGLKERGHEVLVLSLDDAPLAPEFRRSGIQVETAAGLGERASRNPLTLARVARRVGEAIRKVEPDVVHSHGPRAHLFTGLAWRSRRNAAWVASFHGSFSQFVEGNEEEAGHFRRRLRKLQYGSLDRLTVRAAGRGIAVCEATRKEMVAELGINPGSVAVVPNGVEEPRLDEAAIQEIRGRFGCGAAQRLVTYVGRVAWHKGARDLIEAMEEAGQKRPEARFLIVGDGPMENELRRRAETGPLRGRARVKGRLDCGAEIIAASDIILLPSLSEGLPITLLEAAAAGRPAVATNVGGIPEIVRHGETGLLVKPRRPHDFAEAILELLDDEPRRLRMGAAAKLLWRQEFTLDKMVDRTEAIYEEIVFRRQG